MRTLEPIPNHAGIILSLWLKLSTLKKLLVRYYRVPPKINLDIFLLCELLEGTARRLTFSSCRGLQPSANAFF